MDKRVCLEAASSAAVSRCGWLGVLVAVILAALLVGFPLAGCSGGSSGNASKSDSAASQSNQAEESSSAVSHGKLVEIEATYDGPTAPGTVIDSKSDITVYGVYEDGSKETLDGWKVKKKVTLETAKESTVTIKYKKLSTKVTVMGDIPSEYASAMRKAQSYAETMHMSKAGIYDQLTSEWEGFESEAADYAVNHVDVDWKENALIKARDYRDTMAMSPSAIHDQLTSDYGEKFTQEEADYAIEHLDDDNAATSSSDDASSNDGSVPTEYQTALRKAQSYSDTMHMSKARLYDQLTSDYGEQYSAEAAQYAVDNVDADWNENALATAKNYRDTMDMSPAAIHDQLTSEYGEQFTQEEADYAIAHLDD